MKIPTTFSFLTIMVLAFGAAHAAPMLDLGDGAEVHFTADVSFIYEDNLLRRSINKDSDMHVRFSPGVVLTMSPDSASSTTVSYRHHFNRYQDFSEFDSDFSDFKLNFKYDSGVVMANAYVNYLESYSNTYSFDQANDIFGVLIERENTSAGASLRYELSELTAVKAGMDHQKVDYASSSYVDHKTVSVPITFFYKVRPKVDLTAGLRYRTTDTSASFEYEDLYYYVGAVGELFSPVVYADLTVGYQDRSVKSGGLSLPDTGAGSYNLSLIYTGNPKSTFYASFSRDYNTSAFNGSSYVFTRATLGARYSLSNAVGVSGSLSMGEGDYESNPFVTGPARSDDIVTARLEASYRPNDYLTVRASYNYRDVEGNVANYTENEFRVTASLRY